MKQNNLTFEDIKKMNYKYVAIDRNSNKFVGCSGGIFVTYVKNVDGKEIMILTFEKIIK